MAKPPKRIHRTKTAAPIKHAGQGQQHQHDPHGGNSPPYMPTPEEIEARAAEIRATWSVAELRRRAGLEVDEHWTPPVLPDVREDFR